MVAKAVDGSGKRQAPSTHAGDHFSVETRWDVTPDADGKHCKVSLQAMCSSCSMPGHSRNLPAVSG